MEVKENWKDKFVNEEYTIYESKNGVKIIETVNPNTREFKLSLVLKGGFAAEIDKNFLIGTSHFWEHLMAGPGKVLNTNEAIRSFLRGNLRKPTLYKNACTTYLKVYFVTWGHIKGFERSLK